MTDETPPGAPASLVHERLRWQPATIRRIERRTPTVVSFFLAPAQPFGFRAGQHVDVRLTAPDGYRAERSYSIASAPETPELIELTIERLDDGEVSPYFHDVAAVGDEIELRGPIGGYFVWTVADPAPVMLVAGGSGIVPFMSMLRHRAHQLRAPRAGDPANGARTAPPRVLLLFSARTWDDVIYRDALLDLDSARDGFDLAIALTRDTARRAGDYSRRVGTPMMRELLARLPEPPRQVYICGSNPFVEAASQALIAADVPRNLIRTERYGG
ncbi:MAG TPA: ferredoxin reductase [Steroidobacteraceae bacterium]|nr:ferredoxin reductase [Steroidobacteraceae bacterium]